MVQVYWCQQGLAVDGGFWSVRATLVGSLITIEISYSGVPLDDVRQPAKVEEISADLYNDCDLVRLGFKLY